MNPYRARPNHIPWPPLLLVGLSLAAIGLNLGVPMPLMLPGARMLGGVLIGAAIGIDLWAMRTLHEARTTILPNRGSSHLVTHGPFSYSRNPIYLANMVLMIGIGFLSLNAWFLVLAVINGILTHFLAVRREENHLIAKFGYQFETYCRKVRRWI
ncbi:MAG: isoprenylcysteine carboxylmethyltransferase family protein [Hoeflea sp.]|uniref:methyltransferase family protein n=1 Tax=Hoeflea sp. TaxID=1940281 RepID=UPI001D47D5E8|nr:isoprenylcysteine carboxylmethyltransferase family protein [Hoeflea sp.]MBU4529679.1 isoprenylcysteine carboxylmethyltransferase family protein [Alphaproteobacteria bacterium]MBU4546798.1 isoprenylcysteine carboxylmethyltransferase family protein [Alphaproteobacteria bacterium]MBU4551066.1 isoprenylcysteine carboxylmethyltransferase family protein [Alphaproteobacteria bacterium]MBV1724008.1 isoprenylcysteine carboxylmethyltransferase family protein [Hoeflea sp.]MBV1763285.1 isoprenylcystein